ncbi:MAG: hypothetical protein AAF849_05930 [Bacteroidota bacterium]
MSEQRSIQLSKETLNLQIDSKKVGEKLFDAVVHLADFKLGSFVKDVTL